MLAADFADSSSEPVGFSSTWQDDVHTRSNEAQTDELQVVHQKIQHPKLKDAEMQSEAVESIGAVPVVRSGFERLRELDSFLEQCTPLLEQQLHQNLNTRAFDGHDVSWGEQYDHVTCLHSLKQKGALAALSPQGCTAVAWNAPGTVIAAAYGALDRDDWPRCSSMLCTWSIFRRGLDPHKADVIIELPDCLTCLAFHPEDPSLLAGGSYNGDVLLWRIGMQGDPLVGKSVLTNYTHHEPVQQLAWTRDPHRAGAGYVLASVSADGKLLLWSQSNAMRAPVLGFHMTKPDGQARRAHGGKGDIAGMSEGGAAISFSVEDPTTFVVGLEAGQLLKGSLIATEKRKVQAVMREHGELPWTESAAALLTRVEGAVYHRLKTKTEKEAMLAREREVLLSHVYAAEPEPQVLFPTPTQFKYASHSGPVYQTCYSPFHRNVFLSTSTDGTVRLYNQLQQSPFHVVEPSSSTIFCAAWSPSRPLVFAAGAGDGLLFIYDLKRNKARPEVTLKVTDDKSAVTSVAFNPRSPELLATADAQGFVKVWRLPTLLSEVSAREADILNRMATRPAGSSSQNDIQDDDYEDGGFDDEDDD